MSFASQNPESEHLDTLGHGTHLAGIIAGRDAEVPASSNYSGVAADYFVGVAPDAPILSPKVADKDGATGVSQVIAAIDWVIQNKNSSGMNIRVINLAFGTDSTRSYVLDPLAYAVEKAWHAEFVVVVAARNDGNNNPLRNPALNPYVIAVGAVDLNGTNSPMDDFVSDFSNCGTIERHVDVVAPGRSITSLRAPGSVANPGPRHRPPRTRRRRARRRAGHHGKLLGRLRHHRHQVLEGRQRQDRRRRLRGLLRERRHPLERR